MRWRLGTAAALLVASLAGSCQGESPPHSCQGVAVAVSGSGSTPDELEALVELGRTLETALPGVICRSQGLSTLLCSEGDVCGLQALEETEMLGRVREVVEQQRPELVTESNPQLELCPCRVY